MRHPFLLAAVAVLFFALAFWSGSWGGRQLKTGLKAASGPPSTSSSPLQPPGQKVAAPQLANSLFQQQDTGRFFALLFDGGTLGKVPSAQLASALRLKFAEPYPRDANERERELIRRVGLLKAVDRFHRRNGEPELYVFYRELLGDSPFLVRRQALRNLSILLAARPEGERRQVLREAGARVLASAALSDEELLEQVFRETR